MQLTRSLALLGLLLSLSATVLVAPALGQSSPAAGARAGADALPSEETAADVSVFVFRALVPEENVSVAVDGEPVGVTNRNGALFFQLAPRERQVTIRPDDAAPIELPLNLVPGENLQILVRLQRDGTAPAVSLESSNKATETGAPVAAAAEVTGDPGTLSGYVFSAESGQPVANARVFLSGTAVDVRTGEDGRFQIELNPGSYSLSVMHPDHATLTRSGIAIAPEEDNALELELVPAGLELPDFVVLEPFVEGSLASVIEEQRTSAGVTNVLGAEQISRAGDSDAAGALKRVTGLTLVDGQFIYVRGLGERYATTQLNAASVPSPDPTRRVVPLDLFPASIIASVLVSKSYSAEIPAGFGGGAVQIRTKAIPDTPFFQISSSLGWNSQTTGKAGLDYNGGSDDWTGYDDGTRELPSDLEAALTSGRPIVENRPPFVTNGFTSEELQALGRSLPNNYTPFTYDVPVDKSGSASGGYRWTFGDDIATGFLAAVDYSDGFQNQPEIRRTFRLSAVTESGLEIFDDFEVDRTIREIELSGFLTTGIELGENHTISGNLTYLRLTEDETLVREGFLRDQGGDVRFTELRWEERELYSRQLFGESKFPNLGDLRVDWYYDNSSAKRNQPDQRLYRQDFDENRDAFGLSLRPGAIQRVFEDLDEDTRNYGFSFQLPASPTSWFDLVTEVGIYKFERDRDSQIFRLQFRDRGPDVTIDTLFLPTLEEIFAPELISPAGWVIDSAATRPTDNYQALQDIDARYVSFNGTLFEDFKLYLGFREEESVQQAITFDPFAASLEPIVSTLTTDDLYPSGTITWEYSDSSQIRFAYAETVNRPDLRELSPAPFRDPILDLIVIGNPELQAADIKHYDLRWEKYFSPAESISFALFRKEFTNPIERTIETGAAQNGSFANALSAVNEGYEIDFYKQLDFKFLWDWMEAFYIAGNAAFITSSIEIDPFAAGNLTSQERPLQGQSDVVANFQLGYDNEDYGIRATLLFNHTGERISDVGTQGLPDIVEQPFNQLDFVYSQEFGAGWQVKLKLQNLLDDDVEFLQSTETFRSYQKGRAASVSVQYTFE